MVLKSKRGDLNFYLIGILVTVISFFVYIGFFSNISGTIVSESDDLYCRAALATKSNGVVKTGEFFMGDIIQKCKKDDIRESVKTEDEALKVVADSMKRCWYRYGEGQYDFMSSWNKEGNWCFTCANIKIKDNSNGPGIYSYKDLIDWMSENDITYENGTKISYYDYVNVKYSPDVEYEGVVGDDIRELLNEGEGYMKSLAVLFSEQYMALQDLRAKQIRSDEEIFVVYRYDKPDNDAGDVAKQALYGAAVGAGVSLATSIGGEFLLDKAITAGICAASTLTGPLAPFICGAAVVKTAKNVYDTGKKIQKSNRLRVTITKVWTFLQKSVEFSKTAKKERLLNTFTGSIDDIKNIATKMEKVDPIAAKKLYSLEQKMKKLNIKDIENFDFKKKMTNKDYGEMREMMENAKDLHLRNNKNFDIAIDEIDADFKKDMEQFNDLEKEVFELFEKSPDEFAQIMANEPEKANKIKKYLKGGYIGASAIVGGYVGGNLNFHSNQYVDLMTREQYYRLCGTEPESLQK